MLAGRAVGLWTDSDLTHLQKEEKRFTPQMEGGARERLLRQWRRAVSRAEGWAEE